MADLDDIKEGKDFGIDRPQQNTLYTLKGCGCSRGWRAFLIRTATAR